MLAYRGMAFWPGLPSLWRRGEIYSLSMAILFSVLLNLALLGTFYWTEWASPWIVRAAWIGLAMAAIGSAIINLVFRSSLAHYPLTDDCDRLLAQAQVDYLRGEYIEAEASLHKILAEGHEDVEAALLLATIFRRTGRYRQSQACLERMERLDQSLRWHTEINQEKSINLRKMELDDSPSAARRKPALQE